MENTDPDNGFTVDAFIVENYFYRNMVLGFDIWSSPEPAEFIINVTDPTDPINCTNETLMTFDEIYIAENWANMTIECGGEPPVTFLRGDADNSVDGAITMSDALYILRWLYVPGSPPLSCDDTGDADDNGDLSMSDALYILRFLYVPGSPIPPAPGPYVCGPDPTDDALGCDCHSFCMGC
jgi:hypothetical protein